MEAHAVVSGNGHSSPYQAFASRNSNAETASDAAIIATVSETATDHIAFVAIEIDQTVWRGPWTYGAARVTQIDAHLQQYF